MHDTGVRVWVIVHKLEHGFRFLKLDQPELRGIGSSVTFPSGCTMFSPIWRSTVKSGSSLTISSLGYHLENLMGKKHVWDSRREFTLHTCNIFLTNSSRRKFFSKCPRTASRQRNDHKSRSQTVKSVYSCISNEKFSRLRLLAERDSL